MLTGKIPSKEQVRNEGARRGGQEMEREVGEGRVGGEMEQGRKGEQ